MKKTVCLILALLLLLSVTACDGNYAKINLNEPISIPENGIIKKSVLESIRENNAIATFTGTSEKIKYEWTVFGTDVNEAKDINLHIDLKKDENCVKISFAQTEDIGFPILLSIYLNEKLTWNGATAYSDSKAVYSVSVTGSKTSILNISVNSITAECEILPDSVNMTENTVSSDTEITTTSKSDAITQKDNYLSDSKNTDNRIYSDGENTEKDKYDTDPIPEGKPMPVEPENQEINNKKTYTCTFSIECSTILNNLSSLDTDKLELLPTDGVILSPVTVMFYEGESVYDVLQRVCRENNIHLESSWTPVYNSAYVEGINNLYEFDCGELSGWMYSVNGWYPNYGCSRYQLADGERIEFRYTCDLGRDIGCDWMA